MPEQGILFQAKIKTWPDGAQTSLSVKSILITALKK